MDNRPVGVFDSGVGGLTVAREIMELLPQEELVYFGDSGRAPYGVRSVAEITEFSFQIGDFLMEQGVKAMVVGCNTICVACIESLRRRYPVPVFDVITPGVEAALRQARESVLLLGTTATVNSGVHRNGIRSGRSDVRFHAMACPTFIPIVEAGEAGTPTAYRTVAEALSPLSGEKIDTLILGCTHFPLLRDAVRQAVGDEVSLVDPARGTAEMLREHLREHGLLREAPDPPRHSFYMSGDEEKFRQVMQVVFGKTYPCHLHRLEPSVP